MPAAPAQQTERTLVPIACSLKFVQGYRCSRCGWARLFPECHVKWAVPFCYQVNAQHEFEAHQCDAAEAGQADF